MGNFGGNDLYGKLWFVHDLIWFEMIFDMI